MESKNYFRLVSEMNDIFLTMICFQGSNTIQIESTRQFTATLRILADIIKKKTLSISSN